MLAHVLWFSTAAGLSVAGAAAAQTRTASELAALSGGSGAQVAPAAPAGSPAAPAFRADSIFVNPDVRPQFAGGDAALRAYMVKNLRYPDPALRQRTSGKVFVRFIVSAEGRITDASVVRGPGFGLNEEALRLVWLMPPWVPGRQAGQPVRVSCTIPIDFQAAQ